MLQPTQKKPRPAIPYFTSPMSIRLHPQMVPAEAQSVIETTQQVGLPAKIPRHIPQEQVPLAFFLWTDD